MEPLSQFETDQSEPSPGSTSAAENQPPQAEHSGGSYENQLRADNEKLQAELEQARREIERHRDRLELERREAEQRWDSKLSELEQLRVAEGETSAYEPARVESESTGSYSEPERHYETRQPPARAERTSAPRESSDDDESIEDYMVALLGRMRGTDSTPQPGERPAAPPPIERRRQRKSEADTADVEPAPDLYVPPVVEEPAVILPATELMPRSRPAIRTDFTAMRELANTQALIAIHTHSRKQLIKTIATRLVGAAVCLVGGVILQFVVTPDQQTLFVGAAGVIVAGVYLLLLASKDVQKFVDWYKTLSKAQAAQSSIRTEDAPPADVSRPVTS